MTPETLEAEARRTDEAIASFHSAVVALPQPRDKRLRYLAIRLSAFDASGQEMVAARLATLDALNNLMLPGLTAGAQKIAQSWVDRRGQQQMEREAHYARSISYLVASEQVALGTSTVRDALEGLYLGASEEPEPQSRKQRDSVFTVTERVVRSEIAAMR